jgi:uncharacterized membrane protein YbhN (UPF0104 family)
LDPSAAPPDPLRSLFTRRTLGRWLLGLALLAGLVAWVQSSVGWGELLAPWQDLPAAKLALLLLLIAASYALRAVRIYDYHRRLLQGAFPATLRLTLLHNSLNNFLPMRLGELAFPILMKRYFRQGYTASSVTLLWLRLLDLHLLGLLALVFWFWTSGQTLWLLLTLPWMALVPGLYWGHGLLQRRLVPREGRLARLAGQVLGHVPDSAGQFFRIWIWTALSWGCKFMAYTAVVLHFSAIDLGRAVLGTVGAELSSVLPVHGVAGAGTYELAMSAVLLPLGLDVASVLKAAVNLHLYLLGASLLLALWALLLPRPAGSGDAG